MFVSGVLIFTSYADFQGLISSTNRPATAQLDYTKGLSLVLLFGSLVPLAIAVLAFIIALRTRQNR